MGQIAVKSQSKRKSHPLTLIEILICLAILALIGTAATVKGFQTYKVVQKRYSEERFKDELLLTKVLALTHQMDITLEFAQKKNKLLLTRRADYVPPKLHSYFNRPLVFPGLRWDGAHVIAFYSNNPSSFEIQLELH